MLEPGDQLFKLAAKRRTKDIYSTIETIRDVPAIKPIEELKKDIEDLSVQYQVLTGETAFIGVIKQLDTVTGEMIKVLIPTTQTV